MRRLRQAAHNFWRFLQHDQRRVGLIALCFLFVAGGVLYADTANAETGIVTYLAQAVNWLAQALTKFFGMIFVFASSTLVWIMGYNDFINSTAVRTGWLVVRDFTNMMFILVLLVIAFGIMFGRTEYGDVSMLPSLIAIALIINFSRTLIGFMIDISQVFTLTFVNAFTAAGAGNFAQIFSVSEAVQQSPEISQIDVAVSLTLASFFGLATVMVATIIMVVLLIVMAYRIVALWLLTILAPLAWFMRIVPTAQEYYKMWWSEFKKNLLMGPVMAFFLWLTLATASAASSEVNLPRKGETYHTDQKLAAVESASYGQMMMGLIAIAMLLKGLEISASLGGVGAGLLTKAGGAARGAVGLAGAGVLGAYGFAAGKATRGAARLAGVGAAPESARGRAARAVATAPDLRALALGVGAKGMQAAAGGVRALEKVPGLGAIIPSEIGAKITAGATAISGLETKMLEARRGAAKAAVVDVTKPGANVGLANQQMRQLVDIPPANLTSDQKDQLRFMSSNAIKNPEQVSKLKPEDMPKLARAYADPQTGLFKDNKTELHNFAEFQAKNLDKYAPEQRAGVMAHLGAEDPKLQTLVPSEAITPKLRAGETETSPRYVAEVAAARDTVNAMSIDAVVSVMKGGKPEVQNAVVGNIEPKKWKEVVESGRMSGSDVDAAHIERMSAENVGVMMASKNDSLRTNVRESEAKQVAVREKLRGRALPAPDPVSKSHDLGTAQTRLEVHLARNKGTDATQYMSSEETIGANENGLFTGSREEQEVNRNDVAKLAKSSNKAAADVMLSFDAPALSSDFVTQPQHVVRQVLENSSPSLFSELAGRDVKGEVEPEKTEAIRSIIKNIQDGSFGDAIQQKFAKTLRNQRVQGQFGSS